MKILIGIIVVIGIIWFVTLSPEGAPTNSPLVNATGDKEASTTTQGERTVVSEGSYVVKAEESKVNWAGKKPLIEGYINSGSIDVTGGTIEVLDGTSTGVFTIDMNTLSVSQTPAKPGKESTLEGHLKSEGWFNVETYPEASFAITEVSPRADSDTTHMFDITGDLTMKGITDTLTFPATIYSDENGTLYANAEFEFDRTVWGITAASGSFFDNLADNVIDDMVALSFNLVATKE